MIQIDMEMPKSCKECSLPHIIVNGNYCYSSCSTGRPDWCPLHEVTEDPDTISRQAVLDAVDANTKWSLLDRNGFHVGVGMKYRDVKETVKNLPPSPSRPQIHCNKCNHYQGVHGVQGHAPCSYWGSGGVLWNWYCSQAEPYREGEG